MNTHGPQLPEADPAGQGDDRYLIYIIKWYEFLHPEDRTRYAIVMGEPATIEKPGTLTFLEIINDSKEIVWNAKTGGSLPYEKELGIGYLRRSGSSFPEPDYIAYIATKLATKDASTILPYVPGTYDTDQPLKKEVDDDGVCAAYFDNGVIMLVKIPIYIQKENGDAIENVQGFIAYSIIQNTLSETDSIQVIKKEEYQELFGTADPQKIPE